MQTNNVQYYNTIHPTVGENVLVVFSENKNTYFDGKLLEYPYIGIMNYRDATKKRKVSSWKQIVPLDKPMVARVDMIDTKAMSVQLSIAYFDEKNMSHDEIQKKYMIQFNDNRMLENFINSLCASHDYKYDEVWPTIVHPLDKLRRELNDEDEDEEPITIWKYFSDNIDNLEDILELEDSMLEKIKQMYKTKNVVTPQKIVTKIGIISLGGVDNTKKLLTDVLKDITFNYMLKYESTPNYSFTSETSDSSKEDHIEFVKQLELGAQQFNPKIFIKLN